MNSSSGSLVWSQQIRPIASTMSSITLSESFNFRKNAGMTPKMNLKPKNSIETLRNKLKHESQIEIKENTSTNVLNADSPENSRYSKHPDTQEPSMPVLTKETNKSIPSSEEKITQYSSITESTKSRSSPISISQFNFNSKKTSSFVTVDATYDSDTDMFDDFECETETPTSSTLSPRLFANFSCPYSEEKSNFAPQSSLDQTCYLEEELFKFSREEIKAKIDQILTFLEN
ncbi:uncharacterized protein LOC117173385 isoform X2 [Belonocnema kinseyi]|nr:uncharacterized protein LOC117173385 isoform X2 [Belonocnema kinseyi]